MRRTATTIALTSALIAATAGLAAASPLEKALDYLNARQDPLTGMFGPVGPGQAADTAWVALAVAGANEQAVDWHGPGLTLNDAVGSLSAGTVGDLLRLSLARKAAGSRDPDMADTVTAQRSADGGFPGGAAVTGWGVLGYMAAAAPAADARVVSAVAALRALQMPDGGWGAPAAAQSDVATTSTAIQALRAAGVPAADPALVAARARLLGLRDRAGTFGRATVPTAWAVMAIRALGERPDRGVWAAGGNPVTALVDLQQPDGGVRASARQAPSLFSTSLAVLAWAGRPLPVAPGRIIATGRGPRVVARTPADGDTVRGVLSVRYVDEPGGTGIDVAGTSVSINGVDVTRRARITPYTLQIGSAALPIGALAVRVRVRDRAGHVTTANWSVVGGG